MVLTYSKYRQLFTGLDVPAIDQAQHIPEIGAILKLTVDEIEDISIDEISRNETRYDTTKKVQVT